MEIFKTVFFNVIFFISLGSALAQNQALEKLISQFKSPSKNHVLVAAHRGDWRNAPENSIQGVKYCLEMGVDIMEIDIQRTKDGKLILMHDKTLDRTTTGKGKIAEVTLDSIKKFYLKNGAGGKTYQHVPTLEEFMLFIKDRRLLVNLDKSWDYIPETYAVLKKTGTIKQGIFKGNESVADLRKRIGNLLDSITYMPMVWPKDYNIYKASTTNDPAEYVMDYINGYKPIAFEIILGADNSAGNSVLSMLKENKISVWINTLWPELCAGHDDELALEAPDAHWGWIINNGANIIQTDRPATLLSYLKRKGLHK